VQEGLAFPRVTFRVRWCSAKDLAKVAARGDHLRGRSGQYV